MENNIMLNFKGTSTSIKNDLSQYANINKANSALLFDVIYKNQNLLSEGEGFSKVPKGEPSDEGTSILNYLTNDASYYINIKSFTIALFCLLFDIAISKGLATFLLELYGVDYSLVKLEDFEKCVAYKIKSEKRIDFEQLKLLVLCNYTSFNTSCYQLNSDNTCRKWAEENLDKALASLLSKKIIKAKQGYYGIIF